MNVYLCIYIQECLFAYFIDHNFSFSFSFSFSCCIFFNCGLKTVWVLSTSQFSVYHTVFHLNFQKHGLCILWTFSIFFILFIGEWITSGFSNRFRNSELKIMINCSLHFDGETKKERKKMANMQNNLFDHWAHGNLCYYRYE